MRIGIDARFYRSSTAGIGRYTRALLKELMKIDKKNLYTVFITPADEKEYDEEIKNLKPASTVGGLKIKNFVKKVVDIPHYSISEQTKFLKILSKEKFDLVHFTNFNHPLLYHGKFIVTIHDLTLMLYPPIKSRQSILRKIGLKMTLNNAVKNARIIIADSHATKKDIVKVLKADSDLIKVVHIGLDSDYYLPKKLPATYQLKRYGIKKPYLLFISQWRPHKGILQLVEAFVVLKNKSKIPHQLVIIGKPNPDFPEIPLALSSSPYASDIITPGFIAEEDLPNLYRQADLFVFPSHYEGFGLPPLEAMASGVPVVASKVSCMSEILGEAAVYFDPYEPADMADKIHKTLINADLQKEMIKKGFHQIKKYSWAKMARETLQVYKNVL